MSGPDRNTREAARGRARRMLVGVALAAVLAACGTAGDAPVGPSASRPALSPSPVLASATTTPDAPTPPPTPTADPVDGADYEPPSPRCPAAPGAVVAPDVLVSIVGQPGIIASRGSTTFVTCSNVVTTDTVAPPALPFLTALPGDRMVVEIEDGWTIVRVEGFDAPAVGDGGNIQAPIDTPEGAKQVEVPVPQRDGAARASWTLWVVRADGRAVGQVSVSILVRLEAAGG